MPWPHPLTPNQWPIPERALYTHTHTNTHTHTHTHTHTNIYQCTRTHIHTLVLTILAVSLLTPGSSLGPHMLTLYTRNMYSFPITSADTVLLLRLLFSYTVTQ